MFLIFLIGSLFWLFAFIYNDVQTKQANMIKYEQEKNIIDHVIDYGTVEDCTVKYVITKARPSFWLVRCPNSKVNTSFDTGGKYPVRGSASID